MDTRIHRQSGVLKAKLLRLTSGRGRASISAIALAAFFSSAPAAQDLRLTHDVIADPVTGAALLGFDPVAYFIDQRAVPGQKSQQILYAGKVWYFASRANRAAFEANPALYLPEYGGHDPVAIAAGIAVSGSPEFFTVENARIFLFRHAETRDAFLRDPTIAETARRHWPQVKRDLIP